MRLRGYYRPQCRSRPRGPTTPRIAEVATRRLVEKFSAEGNPESVPRDAFTERREFVRTTGTHREDGAYVVERRGAESAGHRKVFDGFAECRRLYARLPDEFAADDVHHAGVTGARRHMLVWHYAEHDAFDCELVSRQPLTARKRPDDGGGADR